MNYTFHPEAKTELNEAADYYNGCQRGLGWEFAREVYGAIYQITHGGILIIAVMQLNRKPGYWKGRM